MLHEVTLTIPDLPGETPADAARTFVLVLHDWIAGAIGTLMVEVDGMPVDVDASTVPADTESERPA